MYFFFTKLNRNINHWMITGFMLSNLYGIQSTPFEPCTPCFCPNVTTGELKIDGEILDWHLPNASLFIDIANRHSIQSIDRLSRLDMSLSSKTAIKRWFSDGRSIITRKNTTAMISRKLKLNDITVCGSLTVDTSNVYNQTDEVQNSVESYHERRKNISSRHPLRVVFRIHRFAKAVTLCDDVHGHDHEYVPRLLISERNGTHHSIRTPTQINTHRDTCRVSNSISMQLNVCHDCQMEITYGYFQHDTLNGSRCDFFLTRYLVNPAANASNAGPDLYISKNALPSFPTVLENKFRTITQLSEDTSMLESSLLCSCKGSSVKIPTQLSMQNGNMCDNTLQTVPKEVNQGDRGSCLQVSLIITAAVIIVSFLSAGLIYRCRWRIRIFVHHLASSKDRPQDEEMSDFDYDAFVAYTDEDRAFVINDMRMKLEEDIGFRLCIHHRDFIPGQAIADNIVDAIGRSKKFIVVLSPDFLQSKWCTYEVQMAKYEGIRRGKNLIIVVVYRQVKVRDTTKEVRELMKIDFFATFPEDAVGRKFFWENMRKAIQK